MFRAVSRKRRRFPESRGRQSCGPFVQRSFQYLVNSRGAPLRGYRVGTGCKDYSENQDHYVQLLIEHLGTPGGVSDAVTGAKAKTAVAAVGASEPVPFRTVALPPVRVVQIPTPPPAPLPTQSLNACWVPPGEEVTVKGFLIKGGMVYVGTDLVSANGYGIEPALINPAKPVAKSAADCHTRNMNYWPSYDTITPEARASYLQWLASGKCDPESDIGYVFLYFYGLERRALSNTGGDHGTPEIPVIEQEVRRLLGIYGNKGSFVGYATSFLEYLAARGREVPAIESLSLPLPNQATACCLDLRVGLGLHARAGNPLSALWGFAWYSSTPLFRGHLVARCPDVFKSLFEIEFVKRFGEGIKLPINKTRIKVTHRAASAGFAGQSFTAELDLPDVSILSDPVKKLQELGDVCCSLLASYGRLVVVSPDKANSLEGLLLKPVCLWPETVCGAFRDLQRVVSEATQPAKAKLIPVRELLSILPHGDDLNRARFGALSRALGGFGLGIEPDLRFGGNLPGSDGTVALFAGDGLDQVCPFSDGFARTALILHMTSAVASADNSIDEAAAAAMLDYIERESDLPVIERSRLMARLCLYRTLPPSCAGLKKRIDILDKVAREAASDLLVRVAVAGGIVSPGKVRVLESLFKLMGMDRGSLYSKIHTIESQPHSANTEIDAAASRVLAPRTSNSSLQLDQARIVALKADSDRVSALLESVFADSPAPEPEVPVIEDRDDKVEASILDLDADHAGLLQVLVQRAQWSRAELEEICADRGLMPDGAIERINEAAFNRYDRALIEGDDPVDVNFELMLEETT